MNEKFSFERLHGASAVDGTKGPVAAGKATGDTSPLLEAILAQRIADKLIGTAAITSIDHEIEELGAVETQTLLEAIDSLVFECDGCGWWCAVEDLHNTTDEQLCEGCTEEDDECTEED